VRVDRDSTQVPIGGLDAFVVKEDLDDEQRVDRSPLGGKLLEPSQHDTSESGPQLVTCHSKAAVLTDRSENTLISVLLGRCAAIVDKERVGGGSPAAARGPVQPGSAMLRSIHVGLIEQARGGQHIATFTALAHNIDHTLLRRRVGAEIAVVL